MIYQQGVVKDFVHSQVKVLEIEEILDRLNQLQKLLPEELGFLFEKVDLQQRIKSEFGNLRSLDGFWLREHYDGRIHFAPLGTVLHVTASNVALGMIDSMIMGLITKNKNIIKYHQELSDLVKQIEKALTQVELKDRVLFVRYKGGNEEVERDLFSSVDAVLAWGGEDMERSLKSRLPHTVKLITHGPKLSFQVISKEGLKSLDFTGLYRDIATYQQQACANSQNIFLEEGIDYDEFSSCLLQTANQVRELDDNDAVELLRERELLRFREFLGDVEVKENPYLRLAKSDFLGLEPTALNGSVRVKFFSSIEDLGHALKPFKYYLQTCGLATGAAERDNFRLKLATSGVNRFTEVGKMLQGRNGSPHDGEFNLLSLTHAITDEAAVRDEIHSQVFSGHIYASGGTTGEPKYTRYYLDEFKFVARKLGESYLQQGMSAHDKVANLFTPGHMWSSFNAVQMALDYCEVTQYPMGALVHSDQFLRVARTMGIDIAFGLPSLLTDLALKTSGVNIPTIFYAGESLSDNQKKILTKAWRVKNFFSAGYASVEAGPIGYQDPLGETGEHILFEELVELEIIEGQGFVTSKMRTACPVEHHPTGDRLEWLEPRSGKKRFRILGRADKKIHLWSARFYQHEIEEILEGLKVRDYQVLIQETEGGEILKFHSPQKLDKTVLARELVKLYDLAQTRDLFYILEHLKVSTDHFLRVPRTGKTPKFLDLRLQ